MKLWAGRLDGDMDDVFQTLNASIGFDKRMYRQDIEGSIAHATMLGKVGVLSLEDADAIVKGLHSIGQDIDSGKLVIDENAEDIHTFVEQELTQRIGKPGKMLHTGRSRNDQVALDIRMYLAKAIEDIASLCKETILTLCRISEQHLESVMPGYTHMQRAQPVTLAHHLMAYGQMLARDMERLEDCKKRTKMLPLGAGALAGTTYPLDRQFTAYLLGFTGVCPNSMDAISDRDFVVELTAALSILMMHLSRFAEELVYWSTWEFKFVTLSDQYSTGSSIMPQKKNPDLGELVRGKCGRVYGDLMTLLTMMKGLPMAYNKDMQEDKEAVFDAVDTAILCLKVMPGMLEGATFHKQRMMQAASEGFINATDCADYLVGKGIPFRDAYGIVGQLVNACMEKGCTLETLPLENYQSISPIFEKDVYAAIDLIHCVKARNVEGGPAPAQVKKQIDVLKKRMEGMA